jgi:hypothetical protein
MPKKRIRPLQVILLEIEVLVNELFDDHDLQWGDWIWNQYGWLMGHRPGNREEYLDGSHPELYYGPKLKKEKS